MSKGNKSKTQSDVVAKLHKMRLLLDEGIAVLEDDPGSSNKPVHAIAKRPGRRLQKASHSKIDSKLSFSMNPSAFMKKYARSLSGPQKFTLLLARLAEGKVGHEVPVSDVRQHWNKMKRIVDGNFNPAYGNRAKDDGWVDTAKHGVYVLSAEWRGY